MKESERIKLEMSKDDSDNDQRDMNYLRKIKRAERKESFEEIELPLLESKYKILKKDNEFIILTNIFGKLIYYPKANSLLFTRTNYWCKHYGLKWIKKNLL